MILSVDLGQQRHLLLVSVAKLLSSISGDQVSIGKAMDLIYLWTIEIQFEATADSTPFPRWLFLNVCHHLFSKK